MAKNNDADYQKISQALAANPRNLPKLSRAICNDIQVVCRDVGVKAPIRLVLAGVCAKIITPGVDPTKPYTEIGDNDAYSGRVIDEKIVDRLRVERSLPLNATTAFLTPVLRNRTTGFSSKERLAAQHLETYAAAIRILEYLRDKRTRSVATAVLIAVVVELNQLRNASRKALDEALRQLRRARETAGYSPSLGDIVSGVRIMLDGEGRSRVPVLLLQSAYLAVGKYTGFQTNVLTHHNAADSQTGTLGDVSAVLDGADYLVAYEVKHRVLTPNDIDVAKQKIIGAARTPSQYAFVLSRGSANNIPAEVSDDIARSYAETGVEFVVLDCIELVRHILHMFYFCRDAFISNFIRLVEAEADSALSQSTKVAVLAAVQAGISRR